MIILNDLPEFNVFNINRATIINIGLSLFVFMCLLVVIITLTLLSYIVTLSYHSRTGGGYCTSNQLTMSSQVISNTETENGQESLK